MRLRLIRPSHSAPQLLGFLALSVMLVQGCATRSTRTPMSQALVSDLEFVSVLLRHNDVAARISSTCAERATKPELRDYCTGAAARLHTQRQKLMEWQRAGLTPGVRVPPHDDQYDTFLRRMKKASGDDFDEATVRAIRVHAREGLTETTACEERAADVRLKQFCGETKAGQQRVLENARNWICDWFKDCAERVR